MSSKQPGIVVLLHAIDEAYDHSAWHGTNLKGSLRGVTVRQADWRPGPGRHNIRELTVHAAYWKRRARERLTGKSFGAFPISGSNWGKLPAPTEKAWRAERDLLDSEHRALRDVVAAFPADRVTRPLPRLRNRTALREIAGAALHDVYHTGQIQLLKALRRKGGQS